MQRQSQEDLEENRQNNQLSVYGQGKVSSQTYAACIVDIKKSFPKLLGSWYDVLERMLDEEKFTDKRLIDATKSLIKNCQYPEPTLANIISYDKTIKVYLWEELLTITKDYSPESRREYLNNFIAIDFYGQQRYAKKEEVTRYNLPTWKFEKPAIIIKGKELEVMEEPNSELTLEDLTKSLQMPKARSKMRVLTKEERAIRQKQFESILSQEKPINK